MKHGCGGVERQAMKLQAKRSVRVIEYRTIEVTSHQLSTANAQGLWVTLKRYCAVCGKRFVAGDSISVGMYVEDGQQNSGGFHTKCLSEPAAI